MRPHSKGLGLESVGVKVDEAVKTAITNQGGHVNDNVNGKTTAVVTEGAASKFTQKIEKAIASDIPLYTLDVLRGVLGV